MRLRPAVAAVVLAAVFLTSCGDDESVSSQVPTFPGAPSEVTAREPFPFCGKESLKQGGRGKSEKARRCLAKALREGTPAELVSTSLTVEGAPITTIYRVRRDGTGELFIDDSQAPWRRGLAGQ